MIITRALAERVGEIVRSEVPPQCYVRIDQRFDPERIDIKVELRLSVSFGVFPGQPDTAIGELAQAARGFLMGAAREVVTHCETIERGQKLEGGT